jgi:hypothetical protein
MVFRGLGKLELLILKHWKIKGVEYIAPAVPYIICGVMTAYYGYYVLTVLLMVSLSIILLYRYDTNKTRH